MLARDDVLSYYYSVRRESLVGVSSRHKKIRTDNRSSLGKAHVSEIEESAAAASSQDASRATHNEDLVRLLGDRPAVEREGLPRGYRMRADSHYVDQLEARNTGPAIRLIPTRQIDTLDASAPAGPQALAQSIALHGVVQPLLVRRRNGRYQLIAGRKRLAAAIAAGVADVPCLTFDVDDTEALTLAQADNLRFPDETPLADVESLNQVLRVLSLDLARIGSSAALLGPTPHRTFQHRVAADFIQAQAWRAAWVANATGLIVTQARTGRVASIGSMVDRVKAGFEPERRLTRLLRERRRVCSRAPGWMLVRQLRRFFHSIGRTRSLRA